MDSYEPPPDLPRTLPTRKPPPSLTRPGSEAQNSTCGMASRPSFFCANCTPAGNTTAKISNKQHCKRHCEVMTYPEEDEAKEEVHSQAANEAAKPARDYG